MKKLVPVMVVVFLLAGCAAKDDLQPILNLRQQILEAEACTFDAVINADYGDEIYNFGMKCTSDSTGRILFEVANPDAIAGITGQLSQEGGALTFDDKVLAFPMLTQLQLTPVSAPWILLNSLRSGYITGYGEEDDEIVVYIDDSFAENPLHLKIWVNGEEIPYYAEIIWNERRILTLELQNFEIL